MVVARLLSRSATRAATLNSVLRSDPIRRFQRVELARSDLLLPASAEPRWHEERDAASSKTEERFPGASVLSFRSIIDYL